MTKPSHLIRRLTLSFLLPLVLLLSQQGALLHEISHWHFSPPGTTSVVGEQAQAVSADGDFCLTCLAYAQVGGLAKFEIPVAPSLDSLTYHFAPEPVRHVAEATRPSARNRGPPLTV